MVLFWGVSVRVYANTAVSAVSVQGEKGFNLYGSKLQLIYAEFRLHETSENLLVACYFTYS